MLFFGILVLMVLTFIRPQDFVPVVRGWPLVAVVMVPVIIGMFFRRFVLKKADFPSAPQNRLMILFWVVVFLSTLRVAWLKYTYTTTLDWGKDVLIYFSIVGIISSWKQLKTTVSTIVFCAFCMSFIGIFQFFGEDITGIGTQLGGRIRGVGIFDTNQLAYTLSFLTPFVVFQMIFSRSLLSRMYLGAGLVAMYLAIYLTASRGGELCAVLVIFLLFIVFTKKKAVKFLGIGFSVLIFLLFLYFSPRLQTVAEYKTDASALGRIDAWGWGLSMIKSSPLLGIGKDQFFEQFGMAAHNSYIQAGTEMGLLGLFIWIALFYYSIKSLSRIEHLAGKAKDKNSVVLSKTLQISLIAYAAGSFLSSNAYYITLLILFAFVVVLQKITNFEALRKQKFLALKDLAGIVAIEISVLAVLFLLIQTSY